MNESPDLILRRYHQDKIGTLGLIHYGANFVAYTLEDVYRDVKVMRETRIPSGRYEIVIHEALTGKTKQYREKYGWFDYHMILKDVPGFEGILIHVGNTVADTEGCLLIGDRPSGLSQVVGIASSALRFEKFYHLFYYQKLKKGDRLWIDIRDEDTFL